jgi:hypothetical protein
MVRTTLLFSGFAGLPSVDIDQPQPTRSSHAASYRLAANARPGKILAVEAAIRAKAKNQDAWLELLAESHDSGSMVSLSDRNPLEFMQLRALRDQTGIVAMTKTMTTRDKIRGGAPCFDTFSLLWQHSF